MGGFPSRLRSSLPAQVAVATAVGLVVVGVAALAVTTLAPQSVPVPVAVATPTAALPTASASPRPTASPSPSPTVSAEPAPVITGQDGRLTILLLGSDARPSHPGNRTDVIMVVSVDPATGQAAAASIPRDTARFPLPGGGVYTPKVNSLYQHYASRLGAAKAGAEMKRTVGAALRLEVDYYAIINFQGVRELVDAVGGVDVVLAKPVNDPYYWVTSKQRGVHFPAGRNHLDGNRALIFARTRKGDNDFERARRQQLLVAAAVDKVESQGLPKLARLVGIAKRYIRTDLPLAAAPDLFRMSTTAELDGATRVVFGPRKWATTTSGTSFALNLGVVRGWIAANMAPATGSPNAAARVPTESPGPAGVAAPTSGSAVD